jgi:PAS domain S-box-containing protein
MVELLRRGYSPSDMPCQRIVEGERVVHCADLAAIDSPVAREGGVKLGGVRTILYVALRKDDILLGQIVAARQEVRPFSEKEIALVENFAAQAVIAMENARLINETREALEQQTATSEVLQVINSSPGDLTPVFDAILEKAHSLCDIAQGSLELYDGEWFRAVAVRGLSDEFAEILRQGCPAADNPATQPLIEGRRFAHILDLAQTDYTVTRTAAELDAARTLLCVPLRRDGALLGMIASARREVRAFSDKEIALLENFAAQAVIAMENARLLTETREALDQQTATAEVLQVINSSPGDLAPVFDAMLDKAIRLSEATHSHLFTYDGDLFHLAAARGEPRYIEWQRQAGPVQPYPSSSLAQIKRGQQIVHVADIREEEVYRALPKFREQADLRGVRSEIAVALIKDNILLGAMVVYRQEVRPFTDKQIALLQNFAVQAVIAMENARLITETREALEQQTATAEVLGVISSSPADLQPTFEAIAKAAATLCDAANSGLFRFDGSLIHFAAQYGLTAAQLDTLRNTFPLPPGPGSITARAIMTRQVVHVPDSTADPQFAHPSLVQAGLRGGVSVPMLRAGEPIGAITVTRLESRSFTDKQIAVLQNFAAQAVIAIENARLITETREALEQQTATAEVLGVINSSPGDLAPVFDAILEKARNVCGFAQGSLNVYDGEYFRTVATHGIPDAFAEVLRQPRRSGPQARFLLGERIVHIPDLLAEEVPPDDPVYRAAIELGGIRTVVFVPLRNESGLLGYITANRQEVRPFSAKQIALLENFAAQAVIAMENARLLTETREALEQQTATAEVLQVINSSPGNLAPVFDAMLERATRLCEAEYGLLGTYGPEGFRGVAALGLPMGSADALSRIGHPPAGTSLGRVERTRETVQIVDIAQEPAYAEVFKVNPWLRQVHSNLVVPLLKDDELIGVFILFRGQVRPFSDKQIGLVQNFAAQAVIAMENARLLNEIRQRQAELRATFDNMVDGVAMFDEELRLAAWNRNFQELLELSDEFLAAPRGFDQYIRHLTERGEFGQSDPETEIRRLRERLGEHYRFERTRPDGTVIEVRHNPMPDGGVVLIYSDITERKRSEAEIRAARDAAEAAYRDLKTAQASLIQAEKMASLGQLTAGIAHEIKNPLNFVNNFAGLSVELLDELKETAAPAITALDEGKRAEIDETIEMLTGNLEKIAEHGKRADNIVKSMLEHSRGSSGERRSVDLNGLIEEALNLAYHGARAQDHSFNVTLEQDFAHGMAPIEVVPQDITRVCLNLFSNGFYAAAKRQQEGGDLKFQPTLKVTTRELGEAVEIRIRDNGIGIPSEIKDKLFQPFFTTKPTGEGTGLGLSISYDIVTQQHGGAITVNSRVGEFTEFTVRLPRTHRATMAEAAS